MTPGGFLRLAGLSRLRLGSVMPPPEPPLADLARESGRPVRDGWLDHVEPPSLDPLVFGPHY